MEKEQEFGDTWKERFAIFIVMIFITYGFTFCLIYFSDKPNLAAAFSLFILCPITTLFLFLNIFLPLDKW